MSTSITVRNDSGGVSAYNLVITITTNRGVQRASYLRAGQMATLTVPTGGSITFGELAVRNIAVKLNGLSTASVSSAGHVSDAAGMSSSTKTTLSASSAA